MRPSILAATTLAVIVGLSGCGSSDSGSSGEGGTNGASETKSIDKSAATGVVDDFLKAFEKGDAKKACSLTSDEYDKYLTEESDGFDLGDTCESAVKAGAAMLKGFGGYGKYTTSVTASTDTTADVTVSYDKDGDQSEEVYRVGLVDGDLLIIKQVDDDATSSDAADADTARWVENWCSVKEGQTKAEAVALMGEPTEEFGVEDDATPQISWSQGPYSFTAFLDTDGKVNRFWANYDDLGATDMGKMPCAKTREQT